MSKAVEKLIADEDWDAARALIERRLKKRPKDHWLLTQLGVTYYEQGSYQDALTLFRKSYDIDPECPLTLWNIAGVADALGKYEAALSLYSQIVASEQTASENPCWESDVWSDNLKTDCAYRMGDTYRHMGKVDLAVNCYRQYITLLLAGMNGMYPIEDAARQIRELRAADKQPSPPEVTREAFRSTLRGIESHAFSMPELLAS